ncbi:restriction endonuclease [Paraclostridium sordellii]|uniref:restriction endonuclease n=1 Tax=Paraclostridium sordellii TaxID=1505 RepID=UPI0005EA294A|nr:restriction endonuclease [Paeniclostridium sordellii]CEQ19406.1 restriction endonuclease [[Clostridium] sordellii] [Paeniclostridium sordellii]
MARICMEKEEFKEEVKEIIGYKAGLILDDEDILKFLGANSSRLWNSKSSSITFRAEEYEEIVYSVLNGVGYSKNSNPYLNMFSMINRYKSNEEIMNILDGVLELRINWYQQELERCKQSGDKKINPILFLKQSYDKYGELGCKLAYEIIEDMVEYERCSPYNSVRRVDWTDLIELKDLFKSEGLEASYGSFIDQRYIDYLYKNFDNDIDSINWRKFEALTCEFFERQGYNVEIGKGRNDGGIDARIWKTDADSKSPTIIVQCKRQKNKVSNTIVKALYADIEEENAESGLIVTSTEISQSGKKVAKARGYKINWCERNTLKSWINSMRSL